MPTLEEIRQQARELGAHQGWSDVSPEERFLHLAAEVGEVALALRELSVATRADEPRQLVQATENVLLEVYDVVWNACDIANLIDLDLDLDAIAERKHALNLTRRWTT